MKKIGAAIFGLVICAATGCSTAGEDEGEDAAQPTAQASEALTDWEVYFHPFNGAQGGYISTSRLCGDGNHAWICRGGDAPVRFWKASCYGGTISTYYPMGWHGYYVSGYAC